MTLLTLGRATLLYLRQRQSNSPGESMEIFEAEAHHLHLWMRSWW